MAKKTKTFLPKRIAGVKVPKKARKGRFGELLASPGGQAALAEAARRYGGWEALPAPTAPDDTEPPAQREGGWSALPGPQPDAPAAQPR